MDLKYLVASRGHLRASITKLHDKVNSNLDILSEKEKQTTLSRLEQAYVRITKLNGEVGASLLEDSNDTQKLEKEMEECDKYEQKLLESITDLKSSLASINNEPNTSHNEGNIAPALTKLKFPVIPLPEYSHSKEESLERFLTNFEAIIDQHSLSSYAKFVYLKRQLGEEALSFINSLEGANQSFENAKNLLTKAFACEITQKFNAIKRLTDLKLTYESSPYEFVSEMRIIEELFQTLKLDTDTILQFFFWNAMTNGLQTQLVNICNNNKPDLKQIDENIFKAIDRYMEVSDRIKNRNSKSKQLQGNSKVETNNFALVVNYKDKSKPLKVSFCSMCSDKEGRRDVSHTTRDCEVYKTAEEKIKRLESLSACTKCGYSNHTEKECRFRFTRNCIQCGGTHFAYLCRKRTSEPGSQPDKKSLVKKDDRKLSAGVAVIEAVLHLQTGGDSVLPTFTAAVQEGYKVRCLRKSGCQSNFLLSSVAESLNLPVLSKNCQLTVHGFNTTRKYFTNIVAMEFRVGDKIRKISAVCVPEINTKLILPGLGRVTKHFYEQGYKLADEGLLRFNDEVGNIEFVFGTNDVDCLISSDVEFGDSIASVYADSNAGVLLMGNIDRMLQNLEYLPRMYAREKINEISCWNVTNCLLNQQELHVASEERLEKGEELMEGYNILSDNKTEEISEEELMKAANLILESECERILNYDTQRYKEDSIETNDKIVKYVLENTKRAEDGRLIMPLPWRGGVSHLLGSNFNLAKQVLNSNLKKMSKNDVQLKMMDEVFKGQEAEGIIEKINNLENPCHSFLPHMGVFKMERATSKC